MNKPIKGTGVALVTPFLANGAIDYPTLERLINFNIQEGVDFLVPLGTTGEAVNLSAKECRAVIDFTIRINDGRVPLVAGLFGSNYTQRLVDGLKHWNFEGIDAVMSSSPAYIKPSQEGIYQHYMRAADASPRPIIIYNVPGRTASNVLAETTLRLAEAHENFIGVKEATGDIVQAMQIIRHKPADFVVLSGEDPITFPMIACGGDGVISVIANAYPKAFSDMVRAALNGEWQTARQLNDILLDIHPWLYVNGNPSGIKATMEILGLCAQHQRIPLTPVQHSTYEQLKKEVAKIKVELEGIKELRN